MNKLALIATILSIGFKVQAQGKFFGGNSGNTYDTFVISERAILTVPISDILKAFPNPTNGIVHFSRPSPGEIAVFSLEGKKLLVIPEASSSIDLSSLKPGLYLLKADEIRLKIMRE